MKTILFLICGLFGCLCQAQECLIRCEPNINSGAGACGSGFFISPNTVLTANHVVANEKNVRIEFDNKYFSAKVTRSNKAADLALLEVECENVFYKISDTAGTIDQEVICRGFPKAVWTIHKSDGIIKTIQKTWTGSRENASEQYGAWMRVINGMSGGPLLTKEKKVIGVLSTRNLASTRANFVSWKEIKSFLDD